MTIPVKTWSQLVDDQISTWGSGTGVTPVLSQGDFLLAVFEAVAGQMDFLQAQTQAVLNLTRAATSTGADLDSFFADFSFSRLPATPATGSVVLSKLQPSQAPILVPAGTLVSGVFTGGLLVQTPGGAIVYQVVPDTTQTSYDPNSNSYILPALASSLTVTAQAVTPGSLGNVAAGAISQLGSQSAVDAVVNLVPLTNGFDPETDTAFRARFVLYLSTLARATRAAILAAVQGVQQGLQVSLAENQNPSGGTQPGSFTAFVDSGPSPPGAALLAAVFAAVDQARAFTVQGFVVAATSVSGSIALTVRLATGFILSQVQLPISTAIVQMVDVLPSGSTLYISSIEATALSIPGVIAVRPGTTINGQSLDLTPSSPSSVLVIATSNVLVGQY